MVLGENEKSFIRQEINEALRKVDYESIYCMSTEERAKNLIKRRKQRAENREKEQKNDRAYKRVKRKSRIEPNEPSTRKVPNYSNFELTNRAIIRKVFPLDELKFNARPLVLYNPVTKGRMEGDCINFTKKVIFETNEKKCHSSRAVQIRDLQKEEIIKFHNWDLITITEDVENVETYIEQEWQKILEKRMRE